jgi:hypothetical protein
MGRATRDQLLESLKGTYEFNARNGEFIRAPGVDAAFDYLNGTSDFNIAFPDLDKETFPYRSAAAKGRIDGEKILVDEVDVESSLLNLIGQGKVDLQRRQMEGKGIITVLRPFGQVIRKVPIIGSILGGPLLGIPVRVAGSLERPDVTYLSLTDVGAELLNIPLRILGLPIGAIRLFTPDRDLPDKDSVQ